MCFDIVSFSAQVVKSLEGLGQEYRRQVVPEVVHAHLEELFLSEERVEAIRFIKTNL
jgi:hypothetical protein